MSVSRPVLLTGLATIILWLEENASQLPSLPDTSDADMALMYLRHAHKHITAEGAPKEEAKT